MTKQEEFQNKLAEQLEKLFPKGELCSCSKRLPCRSKALAFNGLACVFFREALKEPEEAMGASQWQEYGEKYGYWDYFKKLGILDKEDEIVPD